MKCSAVAPLLGSHVNTSYLQRLHVQTRSRLHHDDIGTVNGLLRGRVGSNNVYDVGRAPALLLGGFGETEEMLTHGLYKKRGEYTTKVFTRGEEEATELSTELRGGCCSGLGGELAGRVSVTALTA